MKHGIDFRAQRLSTPSGRSRLFYQYVSLPQSFHTAAPALRLHLLTLYFIAFCKFCLGRGSHSYDSPPEFRACPVLCGSVPPYPSYRHYDAGTSPAGPEASFVIM